MARYRQALEAKIADVRSGMSKRRAAEMVSRPEEPLDFGDWCQKSHDEWLFVNQNRIEAGQLKELEAALDRISQGDYGVCHGCREPIAPARLEAVPWAKYCVRCQDEAVELESLPK